MADFSPAALRAHEDRMRKMVADPDLNGDLFALGYVIARRIDFDEFAESGLDVIALQVLAGTPLAIELGIALALRELLLSDTRYLLRKHLPEVDWPVLYRWADPEWVDPYARPRLRLVEDTVGA